MFLVYFMNIYKVGNFRLKRVFPQFDIKVNLGKREVDQMVATEWNGMVTNGLECSLYLLRQASYSFVVSNAISCLGSFVVGAQNVSPKNPFSCD